MIGQGGQGQVLGGQGQESQLQSPIPGVRAEARVEAEAKVQAVVRVDLRVNRGQGLRVWRGQQSQGHAQSLQSPDLAQSPLKMDTKKKRKLMNKFLVQLIFVHISTFIY